MDGNPPGQAAKVNPPFNEWADVVKGRANPKSAGPTVRAGATSDRIEMPAGSDVAGKVDSDPVPKRKPIPVGVDVAGKVDNDPVPKRKPMPVGVDVAGKVDNDPVPKRKPIPVGVDVAGKVDSDPVPNRRPRARRKRRPALKPKPGHKPKARALKAASPGPRHH